MRTLARETLFKYIFSTQFTSDNHGLKSALYKADGLSKDDIAYCDNVLNAISEHKDEICAAIDKNSTGFPHGNIYPADRAILYIAVAEIKYINDIHYKVSLNEAANIATKYSSEKSANFVSGVLSGVIKNNDENN